MLNRQIEESSGNFGFDGHSENLKYIPQVEVDSVKMQERIIASQQLNHINQNQNNQNTTAERLNQFYQDCAKKGIQVFFVLPPKLETYTFATHLVNNLPENSVIDLANADKHPEFYSVENSKDYGHLNTRGAKLYTQKLASEFLDRVHKKSAPIGTLSDDI